MTLSPTGLGDYQLDLGASVRDAMESLGRGAIEICFVANDKGAIVGCVTDGDVRRGLLRGLDLEAPVAAVMNRDFRFVGRDHSRAEVLDIMRALTIQQIPVLSPERRLVGIHLLRDFIAHEELPFSALIMAGGRGERLRPLTDVVPKPMVRVAGRPILERLVLHLVGSGVRQIYIAVHYMGDRIESHFGDGSRWGCAIEYLREAHPRGTGGSLSLLADEERPILILNGDLVTQFDVRAMFEAHRDAGAAATVGLKWHRYRVPFGVVRTENGCVAEIEEKPEWSWLVNAGIYLVEPGVARLVPQNGAVTMPDVIDRLIAAGETVAGFEIAEDWLDVGRPDELATARGEL